MEEGERGRERIRNRRSEGGGGREERRMYRERMSREREKE